MDDVHESTPASAVEGSSVRPDRERIQGTLFHARNKDCRCIGFDFDRTGGSIRGHGDLDSKSKTFTPGT